MSAIETLIDTLHKATSQDPKIFKVAEEQLKVWELQQNFFPTLLDATFNPDLQVQVRWLAILYFKNGVDRYWRAIVKRLISEEEKDLIRQKLLSSFSEPIHQISLQLAVVTGRIARTDLRIWPNLIPALLQNVRSSNLLEQENSLCTLNHVIKGLMSKRLASDRKIFKEVSSNIFAFVHELFLHNLNILEETLHEKRYSDATRSIKTSILTLKVLKKLLVEGCTTIEKESHECKLLQTVIEKIPLLLNARCQCQGANSIDDSLQSLIVNGMKLLLETQDRHPLLFVHVLRNALEMAINFVFSSLMQGMMFEMLIVQSSNLVRSVIRCKEYKITKESQIEDKIGSLSIEGHSITQEILTPDVTRQFCEQLVLRYFPLKSEQLEEWENDPECYLTVEPGDSEKYLLRPSIENLFLCLYYEHRNIFTSVIAELLQSLNGPLENDDMEELIRRDAVYFALGLSSYELFGDLNFDEFFQKLLIKELQNKSPRMKILQRRVLWLIGKWIDVSFTRENRHLLYGILSNILNESEDIVVRVTAAQTLKDSIDDIHFDKNDFSMFLKVIWDGLFRLLIDVQQCDTKMSVLNVISILIERIGDQIKPLASALCDYLPHLWSDSAEHNMLRCLVITTLSHLVEALSEESMQLHHFLLPVIQLSTDLKQPAHVYLLDDGLDLWFNVMENTHSLSDELLAMFSVLPSLLEQVSENFKTCIAIMESYIIMDAVNVLRVHSQILINIVSSLVGQMKIEGNVLLAEVLQHIFIALPVDGPVIFECIMIELLKNIIVDEDYPQVMISYFTLFGYMIFNCLTIFNQVVQKASLNLSISPEQVAGKFIDVWLDKVDCITDDKTRKLTAVALVSLLSINASFINERFSLILDTAVNVMHDLAKSSLEDQENARQTEKPFESNSGSLGLQRRNMLLKLDPLNTVSLVEFVRHKLAESRNVFGVDYFQSLMSTMDAAVANQLLTLIG